MLLNYNSYCVYIDPHDIYIHFYMKLLAENFIDRDQMIINYFAAQYNISQLIQALKVAFP